MNTLLVAGETAAEEAAEAKAFSYFTACLPRDAIIFASSFEVLTIAHLES